MTETEADKKFAIAKRLGLLTESQAETVVVERSGTDSPAIEIAIRKGFLARSHLDLISVCADPLNVVPGYRIQGLIGQGGVGSVFKATQLRMDREVAIKTIGQSSISNPTKSKRFQREAQIVGQLRHPNIVSAFDFGLYNKKLYLVMEFVDGIDGEKYLTENERLPEKHAWHVALQVCHALDYANQNGIIHRDIKPGNLILTESPGGTQLPPEVPFVKIADFGLARFNDNLGTEDPRNASITMDSRISGTPYYMSPEQVRGQDVGHYSDIYGLGVTLLHLITGYPPVDGESAMDVITAKMKLEDDWMEEKPPEISAVGFELIKRMCRYNAADRLDDYSAVGSEIESVIAALSELDVVEPGGLDEASQKFSATASISYVGEIEGLALDQAEQAPLANADSKNLDETIDFGGHADLQSPAGLKTGARTLADRVKAIGLMVLIAAACLAGLYFAWSGLTAGGASSQNVAQTRLKENKGLPLFLFDGFQVDPRGQGPGSKWESTAGVEGGRVLAGNGSKKFKCVDKEGENLEFFRFSFGFRHHEAEQIDVAWLGPQEMALFRIVLKPDSAIVFAGEREAGTCELPKPDQDSFGYHQIQIESQPGYWRVAIGTDFSSKITKPYAAESSATIQLDVKETGSAHFEGIQLQPFESKILIQ